VEYEHPFSRASAAQQLKACLSYPNSVSLSVTRWYCIKTAERIVVIFSPHDSPFILVFTADARSVGNIGSFLVNVVFVVESGGAA